ncbi:hypothetical protein, partial [Klebsiella pneumoniae]|uniref:hypothetical protein n=2 Tax=Klebsiella pneumoniae TaxID=573 RepID=UPI001D0DD6CE
VKLASASRRGFFMPAIRSGLLGRDVPHDTLKPSAQSPEPDFWFSSAIRKLHAIICLHLIDQKNNILLIYSCGESPCAVGRPVTYSDL